MNAMQTFPYLFAFVYQVSFNAQMVQNVTHTVIFFQCFHEIPLIERVKRLIKFVNN